jgi:hypothetical protein
MQYTGRSFSELLVTRIFPRPLRPRREVVEPQGLFPGDAKQSSRYGDPIDRGVYQVFFKWLPERCAQLRWVQQGNLHYYIAYFLAALILAFVWLAFGRGGGVP